MPLAPIRLRRRTALTHNPYHSCYYLSRTEFSASVSSSGLALLAPTARRQSRTIDPDPRYGVLCPAGRRIQPLSLQTSIGTAIRHPISTPYSSYNSWQDFFAGMLRRSLFPSLSCYSFESVKSLPAIVLLLRLFISEPRNAILVLPKIGLSIWRRPLLELPELLFERTVCFLSTTIYNLTVSQRSQSG
jgi:hypothetical protein